MVFSLIKDVLSFAWRHRVFLIKTITPMLFILVMVLEVSGVKTFAMNTMSQSAMLQEAAESYENETLGGLNQNNSLQTKDMELASSQNDVVHSKRSSVESQESSVKPVDIQPLSATSMLLFVAYLLASLFPTAIVIHYVRSVFAAEEINFPVLYSRSMALWGSLLGLSLLVWGGLLLSFAGVYGILYAIGIAQAAESVILPLLFGLGLYIHHRLSLAPYFCANTGMDIIDGLKASWSQAQGYVFTLIIGHLVLVLIIAMSTSMIGQILQGLVTDTISGSVTFLTSVIAGFGGILQTIYVYRIYSLIQEKGQ